MGTGRLNSLSDGVFAIAVTLLILDIAVPAHAITAQALLKSVAHRWPSYLAYVVSFSTIGAAWLGHHAVTEYLERVDAVFIRLNLVVLLLVSFLPVPTRLFADYIGNNGAERVAATIYGASLFMARRGASKVAGPAKIRIAPDPPVSSLGRTFLVWT